VSLLGIERLAFEGLRVEIEATAAVAHALPRSPTGRRFRKGRRPFASSGRSGRFHGSDSFEILQNIETIDFPALLIDSQTYNKHNPGTSPGETS
jgi:hypothetical protein